MTAPDGGHIMISYEQESQEAVVSIKKSLVDSGYKTWMDVDQTKGSILGKMAEGVDNASLIVVAMTKKYETSTDCNKELQYSQVKRKKIVPIKLERNFKPSGVLGLIVAGASYVDFSDTSKFQESMCTLKKEIDSVLGRLMQTVLPPKVCDGSKDHSMNVSAFTNDPKA